LQRRQVFCIIVDQKEICHDFGLHVIYPGLAVMDDVVRILWLLRQRSRSRCALPQMSHSCVTASSYDRTINRNRCAASKW
jgi:hypothetical protein